MLKNQQVFMQKQPTFSDISANIANDRISEKADNLDFDPVDYYDVYDDGYCNFCQ